MASRQTEHNRRHDIATLRERVLRAGIFALIEIDYDEQRGYRIRFDGTTHCAGRYEKVYAWLDGYLKGRRDESHARPVHAVSRTTL